ncbi:uncharacterized protein LOC123682037 [Harmonia axyridis]|uniref:uncharacterized protein LOC123682037 n=1 Tax=Harmonia axyridis TaxID=115357 RepID=UPI001E279829|nr:uncharacterized protein LOC123682037 [Harmonia axyridis]XP_045476381.1 uncharacterized protein LOC123682037 [Harmonia axyridis]XP_045476382.1 uncharacterized protein LOC123682037 [Harmonia axyridis]
MGIRRTSCHRPIWCILLLAIQQCVAVDFRNIIAVNTLPDGEVETRISYRKISAKETTVGKGSSTGLKYRQIVKGHGLLQVILDDSNKLIDCDYVHDEQLSKTFLDNFKQDLSNLIATSNVSIEFLDENSLPRHLKSKFQMKKLRKECEELHERLKSEAERMQHMYYSNSSHSIRRDRRDLSDLLRVPGTKWCGKGYSAEKYTRLGMFSRTDRCCRKHDTTCPFWIGGFSTKYGLYNWRINTIMHCGCDERFRACLKLVGTSDANMVGKLFFNVVQTQCFVIKYKKKCIKRSWWGKCEKHKFIKHAILRENLPY